MPPFPWQEEALRAAAITPATLVVGDPGIGANELAMAIAARFCGCDGGARLADDPDALIIAPERDIIRVDDVAGIFHFLSLAPVRRDGRVVALSRADRLNPHAANRLLKILEDSRPNRYLVLSALSARRLPATIVSRCHVINAPSPPAAMALDWLRQRRDGDLAALLAYCGGRPLAALEMESDWPTKLAERFAAGARLNVAVAAADWGAAADWLDGLQKWVADGARAAFGLSPLYFPDRAKTLRRLANGRALPWLNFQRALCDCRALAGHPLAKDLVIREALHDYRQLCAH